MKSIRISLLLALLTPAALWRAQAGAEPAYTLHEWGTFTSLAGSDGILLPGLQREEEALPPFVHSHEGMENRGPGAPEFGLVTKGWRRPLHNVRLKMETPVLYFYAPSAFDVRVEVGFRGGSISQWYPQRSGGEAPPPYTVTEHGITGGDIDFAQIYDGSIRWDVRVLDPDPAHDRLVFKGPETPAWLYPRMTDANVLAWPGGEHEKYLFYRGVGSFDLPLSLKFSAEETLAVDVTGETAIGAALLFHHDRQSGGVRWTVLRDLQPGREREIPLAALPLDPQWERGVYDALSTLLQDAGLFRREAEAMIQTWWTSYFRHPGCRLFWLVPPETTGALLPLKVDPAPRDLVRVLVGRSEILTPAFERELLQHQAEDSLDSILGDRYGEAYLHRLAVLQDEAESAPGSVELGN